MIVGARPSFAVESVITVIDFKEKFSHRIIVIIMFIPLVFGRGVSNKGLAALSQSPPARWHAQPAPMEARSRWIIHFNCPLAGPGAPCSPRSLISGGSYSGSARTRAACSVVVKECVGGRCLQSRAGSGRLSAFVCASARNLLFYVQDMNGWAGRLSSYNAVPEQGERLRCSVHSDIFPKCPLEEIHEKTKNNKN